MRHVDKNNVTLHYTETIRINVDMWDLEQNMISDLIKLE